MTNEENNFGSFKRRVRELDNFERLISERLITHIDMQNQEKVHKLKEEIHELYCKIGKTKEGLIWNMSSCQTADECEDYVMKKIDEIFNDCRIENEKRVRTY